MTSFVTSADGTRIAYEAQGSGPPLILVGGALNDRNSAGGYVPLLEDAFTVVRYDRRGRGESGDTRPWSVEREIEDLKAVAAEFDEPVSVYGHSSGAILGLAAVAAGLPAHRVVTYEPPFLTEQPEDWRAFAEQQRDLAAAGRPGDAVENFIRHVGAPWDPAMRQMPFWAGLEALGHTVTYDLQIVGDSSVPVEALGRIEAPLLSLYGGDSPQWAETSAEAVAAAVPGARALSVPGQTHNSDPAVLSPHLKAFLLG
ncbi:alpha/beta fold hydrolase [Arthrobacter sp. RAF14]|uniref:alpha/beta fold hydrolase n=1 Tax=Arthrobacter sp. RAF14 TaxID=3233051 RepID=UPI003F935B64